MERNQRPGGLSSPPRSDGDAQTLLHDLDADRAVLAARVAAPWWMYPALGITTSLYVASPALASDANRRIVAGLAIALSMLLLAGYRRVSGVKMSRVGVRGTVMLSGLVGAVLALSISFGLAAADARWWISIPAVVSLGLVVIVGGRFDRGYREALRRGR